MVPSNKHYEVLYANGVKGLAASRMDGWGISGFILEARQGWFKVCLPWKSGSDPGRGGGELRIGTSGFVMETKT